MEMLMTIFVLIMMLSRLENASLAFNNVGNVYDYSNTNIPFNLRGFKNSVEKAKKPLMQSISVGNVEEIEKFGKREIVELNKLPSLSRQTRCKYPRISWKARRAKKLSAVPAKPLRHISALRSTSTEGGIGNAIRKQNFRKVSSVNVRNLPNNLDNSIITKRDNEQDVQKIVVLQPRAEDSVILISEDSKTASNQAPKNYVCHCFDDNDKTTQTSIKQLTSYTPFKKNKLPETLPKTTRSTQKVQVKTVQLNNQEAANQLQESLLPEISMNESPISKRLTKQSSSSCVPEPTTNSEPMKIGIPLNANRESDTYFYQQTDNWSSEDNLQNYLNNRQIRPDIYQPFEINHVIPSPDLTSYISQEYIPYPSYTEEPIYQDALVGNAIMPSNRNLHQQFFGHEESVPNGYGVIEPPINFMEMEECIKLYGLEHCIPATGDFRTYASNNLRYGASYFDPKIDLQRPEKVSQATADSSRSGSNQWNYLTNNFDAEEITSNYATSGTIEVNGITLDRTAENPESKAYDYHKQDVDYDSVSKDMGETNDYYDASDKLDKNEITTSVLEVIVTGYSESSTEVSETYKPAHELSSDRHKNTEIQSIGNNEDKFLMEDITEANNQSYQFNDVFDEITYEQKGTSLKEYTTKSYNYAGKQKQIIDIDVPPNDGIELPEDTLKRTPTTSIPDIKEDKSKIIPVTAPGNRKYLSDSHEDISGGMNSEDYGSIDHNGPAVDYDDYSEEIASSHLDLTTNSAETIPPGNAASLKNDNEDNVSFDNSVNKVPQRLGVLTTERNNVRNYDESYTKSREDEFTTDATADSVDETANRNEDTLKDKNKIITELESLLDQTDKTVDQNKNTSEHQYGDELSLKDKKILESLVGQVIYDFKKNAPSNSQKEEPKTNRPRIADEMAVARRLLLVPEVQHLALQDAKRFISDMGDLTDFGLSMAHVADDTLATVFKNVMNSLSTAIEPELLPIPKAAGQFRSNDQETLSNENLKEYIANLLKYSGITAEEVKSDITENILFRTIEHALTVAGLEVNNAHIWDTLKQVISETRLPKMSSNVKQSSKERVSMIHSTDKPIKERMPMIHSTVQPEVTFKRLPFIPVREHVFKDGRWIEKNTLLGSSRKRFEPKESSMITSKKNEKYDFQFTTSRVGHALLGDPETNMPEELNTDNHSSENDAGIISDMNDPTVVESTSANSEIETKEERNEKIPIKYYSPTDRILAYRKKIQAPKVMFHLEEKTTISPQAARLNKVGNSLSPVAPIAHKFSPATENAVKLSKPASSSTTSTLPNINLPTNDQFNEKLDSLGSSEFDTNSGIVDKGILRIADFGNVHEYISTPGYKEYSVTARSKAGLTTIAEENSVKKEEQLKKNTTDLKALKEDASESSLGATTNLKSDTRYQKIPNNRVGIPRDKISNYEQSSSTERSTSTTPEYDSAYFGKITLNSVKSPREKVSDLTDTDLFYIGDGVKIPLKLTKMSDDSWGLSISEKICENFVKQKCPCRVPNNGDIIEERKGLKKDMNITPNKSENNHFLLDEIGSVVSVDGPKERRARSFSKGEIITTSTLPVTEFVKRYNLTLNPKDDFNSLESSRNSEKQIHDIEITRDENNGEFSSTTRISKLSGNAKRIKSDNRQKNESQMDNDEDLSEPPESSECIKSEELVHDGESNEFPESLLNVNNVSEAQNGKRLDHPVNGSMNSNSTVNFIPHINYQNISKPERSKINDLTQAENAKISQNSSDGLMNYNIIKNLRLTMNYQNIVEPEPKKINDLSQDKTDVSGNPIDSSMNSNTAQVLGSLMEYRDIEKANVLKNYVVPEDKNDNVNGNPVNNSTNTNAAPNLSLKMNYISELEPSTSNNLSQVENEVSENPIDASMNSNTVQNPNPTMNYENIVEPDSLQINDLFQIKNDVNGNPIGSSINSNTERILGSMMGNQDIKEAKVVTLRVLPENESDKVIGKSVNDSMNANSAQNLSPTINFQSISEPEPLTINKTSQIKNVKVSGNHVDGSIKWNIARKLGPIIEHQNVNQSNLSEINIVPEAENNKDIGNAENLAKDYREVAEPGLPKIDNVLQAKNSKVMGRWSWVHDLVNSNVHNSAQKNNVFMNSQDIYVPILAKIRSVPEAENMKGMANPVVSAMKFNSAQNVSTTMNYQAHIEPESFKINGLSQIEKFKVRENAMDGLVNSKTMPTIHNTTENQLIEEPKLLAMNNASEAENYNSKRNSSSNSINSNSEQNLSPVKDHENVLQPNLLKIIDVPPNANMIRNLGDGSKKSHPVKNLNPMMDYQNIAEPKIRKIKDVRQTENAELKINSIDITKNGNALLNGSPRVKHRNINEPKHEILKGNQKKLNEYDDYDFPILTNEMAKYDYQKNNPILKRIRFIKKKQMGAKRYRYQQYIDDEAQERMDVMTSVLHWLKEVFFEPPALNND